MSLGKKRNDYWGLVRQVGPWAETSQDRKNKSSAYGLGTTSLGFGGTEHAGHGSYKALIRPHSIDGRGPIPKMSKWAQREVVTKPMDINMRKPVPGKKFGSLPSILKGIAQTLNGIAANGRGVDQGTTPATVEEMAGNVLNQDSMPMLMTESQDGNFEQPLPDVVEIPNGILETDEPGPLVSNSPATEAVRFGESASGLARGARDIIITYGGAAIGSQAAVREIANIYTSNEAILEQTLTALGQPELVGLLRSSLNARREMHRLIRDYTSNYYIAPRVATGDQTGVFNGVGGSIANTGYSIMRAMLDWLAVSGTVLSAGSAMSRGAGALAPAAAELAQIVASINRPQLRRRYDFR